MSEPEPADDIECIEWLREIDFEQYEETFLANFSVGGALLSRKRLAQVRLQDFPKMNILIYEHQKMLLAHIKHTLQYTFHSPIRKREVRNMLGQQDDGVNKELFPPSSSARRHISGKLLHSRRRSFDQNAWDSINKLRSYDTTHKVAAEHLRAIHAGAVEVIYCFSQVFNISCIICPIVRWFTLRKIRRLDAAGDHMILMLLNLKRVQPCAPKLVQTPMATMPTCLTSFARSWLN